MEMKLFQYREQKATKKKNPNMRDGVLAVVVLLMMVPMASGCGTQEHLIN